MQLGNIMHRPALTCHPHDTLNTAAQAMWENDCGSLPVVSAEDGKLVGIITDRDVCMAAYTRGRVLAGISVADAMCRDVCCCAVDDSIQDAQREMSNAQVRRIPIVDENQRPVGIVSLSDVAQFTVSEKKNDGLNRDLSITLASISKPRRRGNSSKSGQQELRAT